MSVCVRVFARTCVALEACFVALAVFSGVCFLCLQDNTTLTELVIGVNTIVDGGVCV